MSEAAATGRMTDRAAVPVVGVVLLVAVTVAAAAGLGVLLTVDPPATAPTASFDCAATADGEIRVTHRGGEAVDPSTLRVRVRVDGRPLAEQPPVPFFAADGFESGPTGPFNSAHTGPWTAGETASLRVASTNRPTPEVGATVELRLYAGDHPIAALETTVQATSAVSTSAVSSPPASSSFSGT